MGSDVLLTIALALFFGAGLFVLANHVAVPAIVPLLIGGILLGPEGIGLINTVVLGDMLRIIISICVAIVLFEGGLTLHPEGFRKASGVITKLLTVGVLATWLLTALAVYLIFGHSLELSLLAGSLIIVTGPTVITPLLKRLNVKEELDHILHWEGVMNDPIGVFIAVLCFEWISVDAAAINHLGTFGLRLGVGIVFGSICGKAVLWMLDRDWIPEEQTNIFVLATAIALFSISDIVAHESGILSVVIAGLVLGWQQEQTPRLKNLVQFKSELTEIAIGLLFVLLAANSP